MWPAAYVAQRPSNTISIAAQCSWHACWAFSSLVVLPSCQHVEPVWLLVAGQEGGGGRRLCVCPTLLTVHCLLLFCCVEQAELQLNAVHEHVCCCGVCMPRSTQQNHKDITPHIDGVFPFRLTVLYNDHSNISPAWNSLRALLYTCQHDSMCPEQQWTLSAPDQQRDRVGYRWKMAVKVRMGEKEILQAMKQAVVMLMLGSQGGDDDDNDEEEEEDDDNESPGSDADEEDEEEDDEGGE